MHLLGILLTLAAVAVATPAVVLGVECLVACLSKRKPSKSITGDRPRIVVLIPAHNEQTHIAPTLRAICNQLVERDRALVIADNCSDATAEVARAAGAEVLVRTDAEHGGKGYAIRYAIDTLRSEPPDVVVCVDADCLVEPECIELIASLAAVKNRPVQAAYLMHPPQEDDLRAKSRVSAFAVLVKNFVRLRGLEAMGCPCLLTGSGLAYPWQALEQTPHPDSHIVEDMQFSIDLTITGYPPMPCTDALVVSTLPGLESAFVTQRTRWEHGHMATIISEVPRLMAVFVRTGRFSLIAIALELAVPPLTLLFAALALLMLLATVLIAAGGTWAPLAAAAGATAFASLGLAAGWLRFGQQTLPARDLAAIPFYVLRKLPILARFLSAPQQSWVRTPREPAGPGLKPHFASEEYPRTKESTSVDR